MRLVRERPTAGDAFAHLDEKLMQLAGATLTMLSQGPVDVLALARHSHQPRGT